MIETFKRMATGVGGSYTEWQGKPPAHGVYWIETDEGQTTVTAYDLRGYISRAFDSRIDSGAVGPGDKPFASEVDFYDLPNELQHEVRDRIEEDFEESDFFTGPE